MLDNRKIIWDADCEMKDSYAVTASALASVDSVAKIFDTGGGYTTGLLDIYVSAIDGTSSTGDILYEISLQGSASSTFGTPIVTLCTLELGGAAKNKATRNDAAGLYKLFWSNMFADTVYRYLRVYTTVTGTTGTGITYTAQLAKSRA